MITVKVKATGHDAHDTKLANFAFEVSEESNRNEVFVQAQTIARKVTKCQIIAVTLEYDESKLKPRK